MKKFSLILLLFSVSFIQAQDCVESKSYNAMLRHLLSHSVPEICVDSAAQLDSTTLFLDAREFNETNVSTIANAIPIGYDNFTLNLVDSISKNTVIVVYCSVGYRSEKIAEKLIKAGYTNVSNLYGGLFEWVNKGYPIYDGTRLTSDIHAYNKVWGKWLTKGVKVYN